MSQDESAPFVEPDDEAPTRVREGYIKQQVEQELANKENGHPNSYVESEDEAPTRAREGYMIEEIEKE